jgi:hypothetical protein
MATGNSTGVSAFPSLRNDIMAVNWEKEFGSEPTKQLVCIDIVMTFVNEPSVEGIVPMNLLLYKSKYRSDVSDPSWGGIVPVKLFAYMWRAVNKLNFPREDGIVPVSILELKNKVCMPVRLPTAAGIWPKVDFGGYSIYTLPLLQYTQGQEHAPFPVLE